MQVSATFHGILQVLREAGELEGKKIGTASETPRRSNSQTNSSTGLHFALQPTGTFQALRESSTAKKRFLCGGFLQRRKKVSCLATYRREWASSVLMASFSQIIDSSCLILLLQLWSITSVIRDSDGVICRQQIDVIAVGRVCRKPCS